MMYVLEVLPAHVVGILNIYYGVAALGKNIMIIYYIVVSLVLFHVPWGKVRAEYPTNKLGEIFQIYKCLNPASI
jgi:hypothetical protein